MFNNAYVFNKIIATSGNIWNTSKVTNMSYMFYNAKVFNQELSTDKEVREFCKLTYAVEFPMTTKSNVTGKNANPFYQELIKASGSMPQWNFHKYLILPQGKKVYAFTSDVAPDSSEILDKIKAELK